MGTKEDINAIFIEQIIEIFEFRRIGIAFRALAIKGNMAVCYYPGALISVFVSLFQIMLKPV